MAKRRNRFMQEDEEEQQENPGEVLTSVQVPQPEPEKKEDVPNMEQEPKSEEVKDKQPSKAPVNDILADLITKPKPKPETYGFYLDSDVHDELVRLAKANKTNKSKFLNALLRRVLFGE